MQDTGYPSPWERHSPEWCFSSPLRSNGLSPAPFTGGVSVVSAVEPCPARFKALHRLQQLQIGSPEILALGKQRLAGRFRQSASRAEVSMTTGIAILGQTRRNTVLIVA